MTNKLKNKIFAFVGSRPREEEIEKLIKDNGGQIQAFSSEVDYAIVDFNSPDYKENVAKAENLQIRSIIDDAVNDIIEDDKIICLVIPTVPEALNYADNLLKGIRDGYINNPNTEKHLVGTFSKFELDTDFEKSLGERLTYWRNREDFSKYTLSLVASKRDAENETALRYFVEGPPAVDDKKHIILHGDPGKPKRENAKAGMEALIARLGPPPTT